MTLAEALAQGAASLRAAGIDGAERDARALLAAAAGIDRGRLTLHLPDALPEAAAQRFFGMIRDRAARRPVSHILGGRLFFDRWFRVTPDVLDPRPETEVLVRLALQQSFADLLDLGTGSGCIAISLLAERPQATGLATDISPGALAVAGANARHHDVQHRLRLVRGDWFGAVDGRFDLIVSNPPYIAAAEIPGLAPEVRDHEPPGALTDGADGLSAYRAIAARVLAHLDPGGRLLLEIGAAQGAAVSRILEAAGLDEVTLHTDLDGRNRIVSARAPAAAPG